MTNFKNYSAKQLIAKLNSTKSPATAEELATIIAILTKRGKLPTEFHAAPKAKEQTQMVTVESFEIEYRKRPQIIVKGSMVLVGQPSNQEYQESEKPYIAQVVSLKTTNAGNWVRLNTWVSGPEDAKIYKYTWKKLDGIVRVLKAQATKAS